MNSYSNIENDVQELDINSFRWEEHFRQHGTNCMGLDLTYDVGDDLICIVTVLKSCFSVHFWQRDYSKDFNTHVVMTIDTNAVLNSIDDNPIFIMNGNMVTEARTAVEFDVQDLKLANLSVSTVQSIVTSAEILCTKLLTLEMVTTIFKQGGK